MTRHPSGRILPALLIGMALGSAALPALRARLDERDAMRQLLRARDALIARAVTDANRPGSLPCPDFATDRVSLHNAPDDGIADLLIGNDCASHTGWLPWATLDLGERQDETGGRLWYALSPSLRDDSSAEPINSDTPAGLSIDAEHDIAAVVIAPRAALAGQNRPGHRIADYLEGANADDDAHFSRQVPDGNDLLLALSRSQLMAAVERRVIAQALRCLQQHAMRSGRFPWASPLSQTSRQARPGSRFGRLPRDIADAGSSARLAELTDRLSTARATLAAANSTAARQEAASTLAQGLGDALRLFDQGYLSARRLALAAGSASTETALWQTAAANALRDNSLSASERKQLSALGPAVDNRLAALLDAVDASGIDLFPSRLRALGERLAADSESTRRSAAAEVQTLLQWAATPSPDLANALTDARQAAADAVDAPASTLASATRTLARAIAQLNSTLSAERPGVAAGDIGGAADYLAQAGDSARPDALAHVRDVLDRLIGGNRPVRATRASALQQWHALADTGRGPSDALVSTLRALAAGVANNGDNLTLASLQALNAASASARAAWLDNPGPVTLAAWQRPLHGWAAWSDALAGHAATVAATWRGAAAGMPETGPDSLTQRAEETLASLNGSSGTLNRLAQAAAAPTSNSRQTQASAALNDTLARTDRLIAQLREAAPPLAGSVAQRTPMPWQGEACAPLAEGSGDPGWWHANAWGEIVFFQIAGVGADAPADLRIGDRARRLVVVSAGPARPGQQRPGSHIGDYLDAENATPGRDGDALAPEATFIRPAPGGRSNDQLAY